MPDREKKYRLGFDLGGTKMLAVLFDEDYQKIGQRRKKTKGHEGAETGVSRICSAIEDVLEEHDVKVDQLLSVGVGCPGPVDMDRGVIVEAVNLGWEEVPLADEIHERFGCHAEVLNDVDAGVYGEAKFGAGRDFRTVFGVFPGTGIGGGCVYEGQILHGSRHTGMEIGHVRVQREGALCGCGKRGCLETVASRLAIAAEASKAAYRGKAPWLMKKVGTDLSDIRSGAISDSIENGDAEVEEITRNAAFAIGAACASVITLLLPDVIVVGGGLAEAMPKLFTEEVRKGAKKHVMSAFSDTFEVRVAELGDDAAAMGAAAWAAHRSATSQPPKSADV